MIFDRERRREAAMDMASRRFHMSGRVNKDNLNEVLKDLDD